MAKNIVVRKTVTTVIGYQEPVNYANVYRLCDDKVELDFSVTHSGADHRFEVTLTMKEARFLAAELAKKTSPVVLEA